MNRPLMAALAACLLLLSVVPAFAWNVAIDRQTLIVSRSLDDTSTTSYSVHGGYAGGLPFSRPSYLTDVDAQTFYPDQFSYFFNLGAPGRYLVRFNTDGVEQRASVVVPDVPEVDTSVSVSNWPSVLDSDTVSVESRIESHAVGSLDSLTAAAVLISFAVAALAAFKISRGS